MKNKKYTISTMGVKAMKIEKIREEISKCRLLCCKCHRIHTYKQLNHVDYEHYNPKIQTIGKKPNNKCIDCSVVINRCSVRCVKCYRLSQRRCKRPSKEELINEIKEMGYEGTGRKYNVSGNAIRKWLKNY